MAGLLGQERSELPSGDGRVPWRLLRAWDATDIPLRQLYPTHCNPQPLALCRGHRLGGRAGGWVDSLPPASPTCWTMASSRGGCPGGASDGPACPWDRIGFSSDANASSADGEGRLIELRSG